VRASLRWAWYTDPAVLEREREAIFRRSWQYAGHVGQLPADAPGAFAARAGDIPVVVTRDREGTLRAFLNVCRHRGSVLLEGEAARASLQCPYHAWTYGLDGRLLRAPRADREDGFDGEELGLRAAAVDRWGPFVFVNLDPHAGPLADALGRAPELVAGAGIDVDAVRFHHRSESNAAANWKVVCENYLECYHCPTAHPGFSALVDVSEEAYELAEAGELVLAQIGAVRTDGRAPFDPRGEVERGVFLFVWPNLTINVVPGRPNLSLGPVWPDGPERTARALDYFFAPDADPGWVDELVAWDDEVGAEDLALVERVQRGVRASGLEGGALLEQSERLVARFDELVSAALAG
jgi:choline monooxygenase